MAGAPYNQPRTEPESGNDYRTGNTGQQPQKVGRGYTNADTGVTGGYFGKFQTNDITSALEMAAKDPSVAAMLLRLAMGQKGRGLGFMSDLRDSLYGNAFQAALGTAGLPGMGTKEDLAGDFLQNAVQGNNLAGYGNDLGQRLLNFDYSGISSPDMQDMLSAGMALQGIGMGGLGRSVNSGYLQNLLWDAWTRDLGQGMGDNETNFADLLANSPYYRAMQAFGR